MFLKVVYLVILVSLCSGSNVNSGFKNCTQIIISSFDEDVLKICPRKIETITKFTRENLRDVHCFLFQNSISGLCSIVNEQTNFTNILSSLHSLNKNIERVEDVCKTLNLTKEYKLISVDVIVNYINSKSECMIMCTEFSGKLIPICGYISNVIKMIDQIKKIKVEIPKTEGKPPPVIEVPTKVASNAEVAPTANLPSPKQEYEAEKSKNISSLDVEKLAIEAKDPHSQQISVVETKTIKPLTTKSISSPENQPPPDMTFEDAKKPSKNIDDPLHHEEIEEDEEQPNVEEPDLSKLIKYYSTHLT